MFRTDRTSPFTLTIAALGVAASASLTTYIAFADDSPATGSPTVVRPSDHDAQVDAEAARKLAQLRAQHAAQFDSCHGPAYPARAC